MFLYKKKKNLTMTYIELAYRPHKNGVVTGMLFSTLYANQLIIEHRAYLNNTIWKMLQKKKNLFGFVGQTT